MHVTVEVVGEGERELDLPADATYADLVREAGYHPQEASALVDGSPVPGDRVVDADRVKLLRLIKGGAEGVAVDADGIDFTAPSAGPGPDPLTLSTLDADVAVLLFHRDFLCGNCRKQVEEVVEEYDRFADRDAEVVSILPEPKDKAAAWVDYHDAPYPIVADPDGEIADAYDQPVRFGPLGRRVDLLGRMPLVALVDLRREPELLWVHAGSTPVDRPEIDEMVAEIDKFL